MIFSVCGCCCGPFPWFCSGTRFHGDCVLLCVRSTFLYFFFFIISFFSGMLWTTHLWTTHLFLPPSLNQPDATSHTKEAARPTVRTPPSGGTQKLRWMTFLILYIQDDDMKSSSWIMEKSRNTKNTLNSDEQFHTTHGIRMGCLVLSLYNQSNWTNVHLKHHSQSNGCLRFFWGLVS